MAQIMLSARHKTYDSAKRCYEDAGALLQMAKIQRYLTYLLLLVRTLIEICRDDLLVKYSSEWHPNHVVNPGAMLALNNNQPARPDIVYYASELIAGLISKNILLQRDCKNVLKVSSAILKLEDNDDIDKKIDEALETLQRAGFGNIGNEILRLITRKLSIPPDADNTDTSGENEESPEANQAVLLLSMLPVLLLKRRESKVHSMSIAELEAISIPLQSWSSYVEFKSKLPVKVSTSLQNRFEASITPSFAQSKTV